MRKHVLVYIPNEADAKKFCGIISEYNVIGHKRINATYMQEHKWKRFYILRYIGKQLRVYGAGTHEINTPYKRLDSTSVDSLKIVPAEAWIQFISGL